MKKIVLYIVLSLLLWSPVRAESEEQTVRIPVKVKGTDAQVLLEDMDGREIATVQAGRGKTVFLETTIRTMTDVQYRVRQKIRDDGILYDPRVYTVSIITFRNEKNEPDYVVTAVDGKEKDEIVFVNRTEEEPIPKTGDRTQAMPFFLLCGACLLGMGLLLILKRQICGKGGAR